MPNRQNDHGLLGASSGLLRLWREMRLVHRRKGETVIYQDDEVSKFYFLKSGYVKLHNITDDGEERTLLILKPTDLFPLLKDPARPGYVSPYFYEAMTDVELGVIDQQSLLNEVSGDRQAAWALLRYVSEFSSFLTDRLSQIESKSAEGKLEHLLPYLIDVCGRPIGRDRYQLELKLSQQELANLLGITRETVSREVQKLLKNKVIIRDNGHLVVTKPS